MILNETHLAALARAARFMSDGITEAIEPKHQDFIRRDIDRINEVRLVVRKIVFEPGLPFFFVRPESDSEVIRSGDTHSKSGP